jgi:hypothetical protein
MLRYVVTVTIVTVNSNLTVTTACIRAHTLRSGDS